MSSEDVIEQIRRCTPSPQSSEFGVVHRGLDGARLEIHTEAVIEGVGRGTCRP